MVTKKCGRPRAVPSHCELAVCWEDVCVDASLRGVANRYDAVLRLKAGETECAYIQEIQRRRAIPMRSVLPTNGHWILAEERDRVLGA